MNEAPILVELSTKSGSAAALVCVPHAGAGVATFASWPPAFTDCASVLGVCLPGRESHLTELPLTSIDEMAEVLVEPVRSIDARTVVLFGHCSGALVAYELAHRLAEEHSLSQRLYLVVSAQGAPHYFTQGSGRSVGDMSTAELIVHLREVGGTAAEILECEELMEVLAPAIRADSAAVDEYRHDDKREVLHIPLVALGGRYDRVVPHRNLRGWNEYTDCSFGCYLFDSDHFYLSEKEGEVTSFLAGFLTSIQTI